MMMMSNGIRNSSTIKYNNPFTASQWQELEHQALIFKYMASGIPIPPDLLFTIRTSLDSKLFLHQHPQHLFQMGYGRKIDPEPGRCRRTDGKKWRCSKEAYTDSKYCERHMHRGRNRSRKPVENNNTSINPTSINQSKSSFVYPHLSSSRPPGVAIALSLQENNFFLESNSHSPAKDHFRNRYGSGMKAESSDEHTFFSVNNSSWKMGSTDLSQMKNKNVYSCDSQSLNDNINSRQQNYYATYEDDDQVKQPKKVMHHFLDEWSPKDKELSWLDSEQQDNIRTQLSISTPNSMHDFFITTPK